MAMFWLQVQVLQRSASDVECLSTRRSQSTRFKISRSRKQGGKICAIGPKVTLCSEQHMHVPNQPSTSTLSAELVRPLVLQMLSTQRFEFSATWTLNLAALLVALV